MRVILIIQLNFFRVNAFGNSTIVQNKSIFSQINVITKDKRIKLMCQLDTAASCNVISYVQLQKIFGKNCQLEKSDVRFKVF